MMIISDFLDNELKIGDRILYIDYGKISFAKGEIIALGKKKATIKPDIIEPWQKKTCRWYNLIIKINE
jgi:hypothetical protein